MPFELLRRGEVSSIFVVW